MYTKLFVNKHGERMDMDLFRSLCESNWYDADCVKLAAEEIGYTFVPSYVELQTMINLEYPGMSIAEKDA